MTRVLWEPEDLHLKVEGHAGATVDGFDPVCAGISALSWALVDAVTERETIRAAVLIDPERAIIDVRCRPETGSRTRCRAIFDTVLCGLRLIADAAPDYITIKEESEG